MDLRKEYYALKERIDRVDFGAIWKGFRPLKFALYDDTRCFFNGEYVEKTDEFLANTTTEYRGEQIAIWCLENEIQTDVLASKIVHEMFHGFQELNGWTSFPNEMEALYRYRYSAENLSMKLRENRLLLALADRFDAEQFDELRKLRKLRAVRFPYESNYEACVEAIEGSAAYVEWMVLKQLDPSRADKLAADMKDTLLKPAHFFPIRISGYHTGALVINAAVQAGIDVCGMAHSPTWILPDEAAAENECRVDSALEDALEQYKASTKEIIASATALNEVVLEGPAMLCGVNMYDARCMDGYITSTYFMAYLNGDKPVVVYGDFVIRMADERTIDKAYRWPRE